MIGHQSLELIAGVLTAAIGVMQQRIGFATSPDRHDESISDELRGQPQPHYGHSYWLGTIAAFRASMRGRISGEELHRLIGMQSWRGLCRKQDEFTHATPKTGAS